MKNQSIKMIIALTILGLISAVLLAYVYQWTLPIITEQNLQEEEKAVFAVLPGAEDYKKINKDGYIFYEGFDKSGARVGVATMLEGGGFQGMITLMVGTDPESGKIYGIRVLQHQETPGLGANITGENYQRNFVDKPFGDYQVVKRPVDQQEEPYKVEAISGATISSEKVSNIVEEAVESIKREFGGSK